jgi:hypothetical protein
MKHALKWLNRKGRVALPVRVVRGLAARLPVARSLRFRVYQKRVR